MPRRRVFVIKPAKRRKGWLLFERGKSSVVAFYPLKKDAIEAGRHVCRQLRERAQLIIRGRNGQIQSEHTYLDDPTHYPG